MGQFLAVALLHSISIFSNGVNDVGFAVDRRLSRHLAIELSAERRSDTVSITRGGRLCGPFHNTCFDTHDIRIASTPIALAGRLTFPAGGRVELQSSLGVRYVAKPATRDLTPVTSVPAQFFRLDVKRRVDPEAGVRIALRLSREIDLFVEERSLLRHGAEWDSKSRTNVGLRWRF